MDNKKAEYQKLVAKRKAHKFSDPELLNPSKFEGVNYTDRHLNPWADKFGNLDAKILLIGQDFSGTKYFEKSEGKPYSQGDIFYETLKTLFAEIDFDLSDENTPLYFTNCILGIKTGEMAKPVKSSWYLNTANEFIKPLINIIEPQIIIAMGSPAYKTVCKIYDLPVKPLREAVENNPVKLSDDKLLFTVFHCSALGRRSRNLDLQKKDWVKIKPYIK